MGAVLYRTDIDTPSLPLFGGPESLLTQRINIDHDGDPVTVSSHSLYYLINVKRIPQTEHEF